MRTQLWHITIALSLALIVIGALSLGLSVQSAQATPARVTSAPIGLQPPDRSIAAATATAYTYTTVITVNSGTDPDTSMSTTCSTVAVHAAARRRAGAQPVGGPAAGVDSLQYPNDRDPKLFINAGHLAHPFAKHDPMPRCCGG